MRRTAVLLIALLGVTGCEGSLQQRLGLARNVPDEFQARRNRPLVIPEDFTLPPPRTVAAREDREELEVRRLLVGRVDGGGRLDPGDRALLAALPVAADPRIRRALEEDDRRIGRSREDFLFVLPFQEAFLGDGGEVLDPVAEAERLARDPRVRRVVRIPRTDAAGTDDGRDGKGRP